MRIGIDGSCLANRRGFGRFARETVAALARRPLAHEVVVFIDGPSAGQVTVPEPFETVVVDVGEAPTQAASAAGRRRLRDMLAMGRAVAKTGLDLIYFPATYSFFPVWNVKHVVVTMHDTLALAHPELVFPRWTGRIAWALKEHVAGAYADRIVTVSQTARQDLLDWFRWDSDRVDVVTEGPDAIFRPLPVDARSDEVVAQCGIAPGTPYLLYVGGLSPHKNLVRLIEGFAQGTPGNFHLVLVGDIGDVFHTHVPELRAAVKRLGLGDRVHLPGFVPDESLVYLYNRAYAVTLPSLMEGFGLPAVEAMVCGTPVLSSTAGSLPEVVGDAGLYFNPRDVAAIAQTIQRFCAAPEERERLAKRALQRASRFTWDASVDALVKIWEQFDAKRSGSLHDRVDGRHPAKGLGPRISAVRHDSLESSRS